MVPPDDPTGARVSGIPPVADATANRPAVALPVQRRTAARPSPSRRRAPLPVAAVVNALWAAIVSFVPMLGTVAVVTLIGPSHPPPGPVLRYSLATWLLAHGVPLTVDGAPIGLVPLGLTVLAGWRLVRAGRNTSRVTGWRRPRSLWTAILVGISVAAVYGPLAAGAAVLAHDSGLSVSAQRAGLTAGTFACVTALIGACVESGVLRLRWRRLPPVVRDATRTGAVAALLVLASGAIATGVAVATAGGTATAMLRNYHTGVAGQAGVILICLVYSPNIATWAAAYLAGPGFTLAGVPELPVFAGLPTRPVTGLGEWVLVLPVLAGAVAGVLLARRRRMVARNGGESRSRTPVGATALAGVVAGVLLCATGRLAAGSLGTGLLAHTGQVGWQFAAVCGVGIALGATVGALVSM